MNRILVCLTLMNLFGLCFAGKGGPFSSKAPRSSDKFTFQDIFGGRFSPQGYSCNWMSG